MAAWREPARAAGGLPGAEAAGPCGRGDPSLGSRRFSGLIPRSALPARPKALAAGPWPSDRPSDRQGERGESDHCIPAWAGSCSAYN